MTAEDRQSLEVEIRRRTRCVERRLGNKIDAMVATQGEVAVALGRIDERLKLLPCGDHEKRLRKTEGGWRVIVGDVLKLALAVAMILLAARLGGCG